MANPFSSSFSSTESSISYISSPADLSGLDDPQLVVLFKSLSKSTEVTKLKALDRLKLYLGHAAVSDALVDVWVQLYPRLSTDLSRRIRALAHTVLADIFVSAGKRITRHLPAVAGAWVVGMHDVDPTAAVAAQKAFAAVFTNPAKHHGFYKRFQPEIAAFFLNILENESAATLSDERDTSPDDADAKYAQVLASGIGAFRGLIQALGHETDVDDLFSKKAFWALASTENPTVRAKAHLLVGQTVESRTDLIAPYSASIARAYLASHRAQSGTGAEYMAVLRSTASKLPAVWDAYRSSTPLQTRLGQIVSRGSQNSSAELYWKSWVDLLVLVRDRGIAAFSADELDTLMAGLWAGIAKEKVHTARSAWAAYTATYKALVPSIEPAKVSQAGKWPWKLVETYVNAGVRLQVLPAVLAEAKANIDDPGMADAISANWSSLSHEIAAEIGRLASGEAQDTAVSDKITRWAAVSSLLGKEHDETTLLAKACVEAITTTQGKAYGAANGLARITEAEISPATSETIRTFIDGADVSLFSSPSGVAIAGVLEKLKDTPDINDLWGKVIDRIISGENSMPALTNLLPLTPIAIAKSNSALQRKLTDMLLSNSDKHVHALRLTQFKILSDSSIETLAGTFSERLSRGSEFFQSFCDIVKKDGFVFSRMLVSSQGPNLLNLLLSFSVRTDVGNIAKSLLSRLTFEGCDQESVEKLLSDAIKLGSEEEPASAPDTQAVIPRPTPDQVASFVTSKMGANISFKHVLPDVQFWRSSLHLQPVSGVSVLGGFDYQTEHGEQSEPLAGGRLSRAGWLAEYVCSVLIALNDQVKKELPPQLVQVYLVSAISEWECRQVCGLAGKQLQTTTVTGYETNFGLPALYLDEEGAVAEIASLLRTLYSDSAQESAWGYYNGLALRFVAKQFNRVLTSDPISTLVDEWTPIALDTKAPTTQTISLIYAFPEITKSELAQKRTTEAIATGTATVERCVLTSALGGSPGLIRTVTPVRRMMFTTKLSSALAKLGQTDKDDVLLAEIFGAFGVLVPHATAISESVWEEFLRAIISVWRRTGTSFEPRQARLLFSSLRLFAELRLAVTDDQFAELEDPMVDLRSELMSELINVLYALKNVPDADTLAGGKISSLAGESLVWLYNWGEKREFLADNDRLCAIVGGTSMVGQVAAFEMLHATIPALQVEKSVDIAIKDYRASLPGALFEAIAPSRIENVELDMDELNAGPIGSAQLQGFLLAWKVLLDHFENASFRLQDDYSECVKQSGHLPATLNIFSQIIGFFSDRPLKCSLEFPETSNIMAGQLTAHLFSLVLKRLPLLARSWATALPRLSLKRARQWTSSNVSPQLRKDMIASIAEWCGSEKFPNFAVSTRNAEITATYTIEEDATSLLVRLPDAYPLEPAAVEGGARVGVSERQWNNFVLVSQAITTFSNAGIVDALLAWKKNIEGAIAGKSECTVCYSLISAQRELPTKRCATCKHVFHSSCILKWFKTSPGSTCPYCRSHFYTRREDKVAG